jgi:bifunctional DNase/RNase
MMRTNNLVELVVREVRGPLEDTRPCVVLGQRDRPDGPTLVVSIGAAEAHSLFHELAGQDTPRGHALWLVGRVTEALGGRLLATRLVRDARNELHGVVEIDCERGVVELEVCASQALAVAVRLALPLLVNVDQLEAARRSALEAAVADIVNGLNS